MCVCLFCLFFSFSRVCINVVMDFSPCDDFQVFWMSRVDLILESNTNFETAATSSFKLNLVLLEYILHFWGKWWVSLLRGKCIKVRKILADFEVISRIQFCSYYFCWGRTESVDKTSLPYQVSLVWFQVSLEIHRVNPLLINPVQSLMFSKRDCD